MRVLIAVDFDKSYGQVLDFVVANLWPPNTKFNVLTVLDPLDLNNGESEYINSLRAKQLEKAKNQIEEAVSFLQNKETCEVTSKITESLDVSETIINAAFDWSSDLIVMGSHNQKGIQKLYIGSISNNVMQTAKCSVLLVKPETRKILDGFNVLVALDGSESSEKVFAAVLNRPWPPNTRFRLITVIEPAHFKLEPDCSETKSKEKSAIEEKLRKKLNINADELTSKTSIPNVEIKLLEGDPKETLLNESDLWPAHLIFLGSRGIGKFERILLGSVSQTVAIYSTCNTEIVR